MNLIRSTRRSVILATLALAVAPGVAAPVAADGPSGETLRHRSTVSVTLRVVDDDRDPLASATVFACPVTAGATDCDEAVAATTHRTGVARLRLDRNTTYEFGAFIADPDPPYACPGMNVDGEQRYFADNPFRAEPGDIARRTELVITAPSPFDCVPVTVTDETGNPLPAAGMFVCPLAADGIPCAGPTFDGPDPDGVIRLQLDPAVTYRLQAFIVNTGWPCPAYTAPNGDTFHFSDPHDLPATQVAGTVFVIDQPAATDCAPPDGYVVTVTDDTGNPLPAAGMFVCPLAADGTPCAGPTFDGPDPDGVIRLQLDPAVTYLLQAFIVNTGWPCPAYTAPNGDTFHFSDPHDLPATQVAGTVFVIRRPLPGECP
jgi:hypothetical protein